MTDELIAQERVNVDEIYMPNTDKWGVELDGEVKGFIALMDNEIGAISLQPEYHGLVTGKALLDKAKELHGNLKIEVFKENAIGRKFYSRCGFEHLEVKLLHEPTDQYSNQAELTLQVHCRLPHTIFSFDNFI